MPRLSKIGAACLAAFGFTTGGVQNVTASYLQVAGGGGGGYYGGGGGAGGYQSGTTSLNPTLSYTVVVGAGGVAGSSGVLTGNSGSNSSFGALTASVGGGYGAGTTYPTANNGGNGGSGGGASTGSGNNNPSGTGGSATSGQGNAGGAAWIGPSNNYSGFGGGGGAGAAGGASTSSASGNGGNGLSSSISGSSVTYAGGGGGGADSRGTTAGAGGSGGGGTGSQTTGTNGTANLGGGGGGGGYNGSVLSNGGNGGSGVVIISYAGAQQFGGGIVTSVGGNTIHTFNTSGTLSPLNSLTASYLIVAGGGGGGSTYTGGGAGGMQTGSGLIIDTNSTYIVTVGAGGTAGTGGTVSAGNGGNSSFSLVSTASIGGGRAGGGSPGGSSGGNGGSGGGAGNGNSGGTGTAGQGNNGGTGPSGAPYASGGGGGAGAAGGNGSGTTGGNGGAGLASSISGVSTYYAGGGGGTVEGTGTSGTGGIGGGGNAGASGGNNAGSSGTANTGGGGGGGHYQSAYSDGGAGGSGIVIISYAGSTQLMAGGTVTIVGGNVIHTFTTSGYLTPLTYFGNSLRFRNSASAYLSRTPSSAATSGSIFTFSAWVKRGQLSVTLRALFGGYNGTNDDGIQFWNDRLDIFFSNGGSYRLTSTAVYRDPAAWYHVCIAVDTTQATASNRVKMYMNGVQITAFDNANYPSQNYTFIGFNKQSVPNSIGYDGITSTTYFDGYLAEVRMIDGQALAPTAFGTFNSYGVWQPINYGGSYGTNGFYLPFSNKTSTTTLGYDFSPAGNNWTTNNISLTTGYTYDSMTDVPTLTSATTANYPVWNTLFMSGGTTSAGNLLFTGASTWQTTMGTMAFPTTGKWYFEGTIYGNVYTPRGAGTCNNALGIAPVTLASNIVNPNNTGSCLFCMDNGYQNNFTTSPTDMGIAFVNGDVMGIAIDTGANTYTFYKNGASIASGTINATAGTVFAPVLSSFYGTYSPIAVNFGQQPFVYTPPSGFVALNTYNL